MNNTNVSVIIPAFNEEEKIAFTIRALKETNTIHQIIVVDDGSVDNTANIAEQENVQVIKLPVNKGKGTALNVGSKYVVGDTIALIDADLGNSANEIEKLINPVIMGKADMTIAIFPPARKKGGVGLVKKTATYGLKLITKNNFSSPLSGQRVMTKKLFNELIPFAPGFGVEVGMTIDAYLKGYKILEIQTEMGHKESGRNIAGFIHRGIQLKDVFLTLTMKGWQRWGFS